MEPIAQHKEASKEQGVKDRCRLACKFLSATALTRACALTLLAAHGGILAWEAWIDSPTANEPAHLAAGVDIWQNSRFDVYCVNPPLVRVVAAVPAQLFGIKTNWHRYTPGPGSRPEFALGEDLMAANGKGSIWSITAGRWFCIPFAVIGAYITFCWSERLYGRYGGLISLTLWCFCPNILGHGHLITADVAATSLAVCASYMHWLWLRQPTWWHAIFSGIALGFAELTKTTLLLLYPLWIVSWVGYRLYTHRPWSVRECVTDATMLMITITASLVILNAGYGFRGTGSRLDSYEFVSASLGGTHDVARPLRRTGNRFRNSVWGVIPVVLPKDYVSGIDYQRRDFERYHQWSYLRNEFSKRGWWYYYLYGLMVKVPVGILLLCAQALAMRCRQTLSHISPADEAVVLAPAIAIVVVASAHTGFSQHFRYVIPALPFVYIWLGRLAIVGACSRISLLVTVGSLMVAVLSSVIVCPHSLSYFNELVGGPRYGGYHLLHSNIDWGQDLLELRRWMERHEEARPINLVYFGAFDPRCAGVDFDVPRSLVDDRRRQTSELSQFPNGWYAISVNFLQGCPGSYYLNDGTKAYLEMGALSGFREVEPDDRAGYSIYIFHIERDENGRTK